MEHNCLRLRNIARRDNELHGRNTCDQPGIRTYRSIPADSDKRAAILRRVSDTLTSNPSNWYALQMRHGTDYDDIARRIEANNGRFSIEETYYPCREIAPAQDQVHIRKQTGSGGTNVCKMQIHRHHCYDAPYQRHSMVLPTDSTTGRYAIPQRKSTSSKIGIFTPLYRDIPLTLPPAPGDRVVVIGGGFSDSRQCCSSSLAPTALNNMPPHPPGSQQHGNGASTPPALTRKITEQQYDTLVTEISAI